MGNRQFTALQSVCHRFGPGRLPNADNPSIGAGYAAAAAALGATLLYASIIIALDTATTTPAEAAGGFFFFLLAVPVVVPAAYLIGRLGWRWFPFQSPLGGIAAGAIGTVLTYLLAAIFAGALITLASLLSLTGADPTSALMFSVGLLVVAFALTWWITIPVGCLAGFIYMNIIDSPSREDPSE